MIRHIVKKEFTDLLRDGRFRWCAGIVGVLLLVSLGSGWVETRRAEAAHAAARDTAREHWESQGEKNPHSAAHYGIYAFKPRLPLSFLDQGVDPYTGTSVWLEAHRQNDFLMRPAQDATAGQRLGALTAAQVLQYLVPLLIILLAFGALAGEREQGTLRQLLATGISRRDLALGKALGVAGALALLLIPAAIVGSAAITLGSTGPAATPFARGTVLAAGYLAYFGVFVALSLAISAWVRSARTALVALLGVWVLNGLVAPRVAVDLSKWLHPTPSAVEFARTMEREVRSGVPGIERPDRDETTARLLAEHGVETVDDLPVNVIGGVPAGERGVRQPDLRPELRRPLEPVRTAGNGPRGSFGRRSAARGAHPLHGARRDGRGTAPALRHRSGGVPAGPHAPDERRPRGELPSRGDLPGHRGDLGGGSALPL